MLHNYCSGQVRPGPNNLITCSKLNFKNTGNPYLEKKGYKYYINIHHEPSNIVVRSSTPMKVSSFKNLKLQSKNILITLSQIYHTSKFIGLWDNYPMSHFTDLDRYRDFSQILKKLFCLSHLKTNICSDVSRNENNSGSLVCKSIQKICLNSLEIAIKPNSNHDQYIFANIQKMLRELKAIKHLIVFIDLQNNQNSDAYLQEIAKVAQHIGNIKTLVSLKFNLQTDSMTESQVDQILLALTHDTLLEFDLKMMSNGMIQINDLQMDFSKFKRLKSLHLDISTWSITQLQDFGIQKMPQLESYSIKLASDNNAANILLLPTIDFCYRNDHMNQICLSLKDVENKEVVLPIFYSIGNLKNLRSVCLKLSTDDLAMVELSHTLKRLTGLNEFQLELFNSITTHATFSMFLESLGLLSELRILAIDLIQCNISNESFNALGDFLFSANQLTNLSLSTNLISVYEDSLLHFSRSLRELRSLKSFSVRFDYLYSVSDRVLSEMGNSLSQTSKLEKFEIRLLEKKDRYIDMIYGYFQYKWLSDQGLKELFHSLSTISSLRILEIELQDCQLFSDSLLVSIGESFSERKMLKELIIKASNCKYVNYERITKYLASFIRLEKLELDLTKTNNSYGPCSLAETVEKLPYLSADACKIILNSYYDWFSLFSS